MKFTDVTTRNLKPTGKKYYVREANGFTLRVLPSGVKTWLYIYTIDQKRRELNLGTYPHVSLADARAKHADALKVFRNGGDPGELERQAKDDRKKALAVADLVDEYINKHAKPRKRTWAEDDRILKKDVVPAWGKVKAADICKRDIVLLLEGIVERGAPRGANNTAKIIRKMFNFAVERDIVEVSPFLGVKLPAPIVHRDRALTADEIRALWNSLDACKISGEIKRALRLILITVQRPGEVIGMHTSEIDGRWWTIPAERSKNKRAHRIYLSDLAMEIIGDIEGKGYIFPCPHTKKTQPIAVTAVAHVVRRNISVPVVHQGKPVFDKNGEPVTENRLGVEFFRPHDLRRTAATFLAEMGFMDEVIDAVLNHVKTGIIKVYNLYRYDREKQQALEAWDRKLRSIVNGESAGKVVSIRRPQKRK